MKSRLHTKLRFSSLKNKKLRKTVQNVYCAVCVHKLYLTNKSVYEKLLNLNSLLHTKKQLSSLRNKKLEKQCKMCTSLSVCVCALYTVRILFVKQSV